MYHESADLWYITFEGEGEAVCIEYITFEIIQRREQWNVVEAACDAYIVKPVEIFFADDIHLPASGVETHFEQRYGRLA